MKTQAWPNQTFKHQQPQQDAYVQPTAVREATTVPDDVQTAPDVGSYGFQYM